MTHKFSPQDLGGAQELLAELFGAVHAEESTLAGGTKLGIGGTALLGLRETRISLGNPANDLIRLTAGLFANVGVELTKIRKRQMRDQFDFYYMTLTVSMRPKRGAQFRLVECSLDFGPKGVDEPIVQAIFPKSEWREVLSWGGGMNLALNGNLDWGIELAAPQQAAVVSGLPSYVQANVANKGTLKAFVVVPGYCFTLGRSEIVAIGEGNSECFWRIEKPELQEIQTVQFGVVFKVPKGVRSIEITGLAVAEPNMNWLAANVRHVFGELSDKLQALLRLGDDERSGKECLPIGDHEKWIITLPD